MQPATSKSKLPTLPEVLFAAAQSGLPESEGERFWNYYESNGWKVGKNPMKSWPHALANWRKNWEEKRGKPQRRGDF